MASWTRSWSRRTDFDEILVVEDVLGEILVVEDVLGEILVVEDVLGEILVVKEEFVVDNEVLVEEETKKGAKKDNFRVSFTTFNQLMTDI